MHGDLVDRESMRRSIHDRRLIGGRGELLGEHVVGVGVARTHHDLLCGMLLNGDYDGVVVVKLHIVIMVVTALLEDLDAIDDYPDVDTNVDNRYEHEDELSDGNAPGFIIVSVEGAGIDKATNGWKEDVEKHDGDASAMRNRLEVMGVCAHI